MIGFPASVRIFVAVDPVDMRKQFNGLWAAASTQLGEDPKSGAIFAFTNRTGVCVLAKRLEKGRFSWPKAVGPSRKLALTPEVLSLILGGIDLTTTRAKAWYGR
jgi:transposase